MSKDWVISGKQTVYIGDPYDLTEAPDQLLEILYEWYKLLQAKTNLLEDEEIVFEYFKDVFPE